MRHRLLIFVWIVLLVACGGEAAEDHSADRRPIERVQAFVAATEARDVDAMLALLTPTDRRDAGWQLRQQMPNVESLEYVEPNYSLQSNDGTIAFVEVSGVLSARTSDGQTFEEPVTQLVELQKLEGEWFISSNGVQLPQNSR